MANRMMKWIEERFELCDENQVDQRDRQQEPYAEAFE